MATRLTVSHGVAEQVPGLDSLRVAWEREALAEAAEAAALSERLLEGGAAGGPPETRGAAAAEVRAACAAGDAADALAAPPCGSCKECRTPMQARRMHDTHAPGQYRRAPAVTATVCMGCSCEGSKSRQGHSSAAGSHSYGRGTHRLVAVPAGRVRTSASGKSLIDASGVLLIAQDVGGVSRRRRCLANRALASAAQGYVGARSGRRTSLAPQCADLEGERASLTASQFETCEDGMVSCTVHPAPPHRYPS